jgi:hypothetical protein
VATPDVLNDIMTDGGWVLIASAKEASEIERKKAQVFPPTDSY